MSMRMGQLEGLPLVLASFSMDGYTIPLLKSILDSQRYHHHTQFWGASDNYRAIPSDTKQYLICTRIAFAGQKKMHIFYYDGVVFSKNVKLAQTGGQYLTVSDMTSSQDWMRSTSCLPANRIQPGAKTVQCFAFGWCAFKHPLQIL